MSPSAIPLTAELSTQWAASAQYRFLDALMSDTRLDCAHIASVALNLARL